MENRVMAYSEVRAMLQYAVLTLKSL